MSSLNVVNLGFEPPPHLLKSAEESIRYQLNTIFPRTVTKHIPNIVSESSLHAPLFNISFRANSGELTVILSKSKAERKTLVELIASRRRSGTFEGDVFIDGGKAGASFDDSLAYVHRV